MVEEKDTAEAAAAATEMAVGAVAEEGGGEGEGWWRCAGTMGAVARPLVPARPFMGPDDAVFRCPFDAAAAVIRAAEEEKEEGGGDGPTAVAAGEAKLIARVGEG